MPVFPPAAGGGTTALTVAEVDGTPSLSANALIVSNGSLTNSGGGTATVVTGGGGGGSVTYLDEGSAVGTGTVLNFVGAGVAATFAGGTATATISGGTAAGSIVFLDEGTVAGTATALNVVGAGGTVAYAGGTATLTIAGGGGALVFLAAGTASASATLDFTTFISTTYDDYVFELLEVIPATDNVALYMRVGTGGGPTYETTNYSFAAFRWAHNGSAAAGATPAAPTDHWGLDGGGGVDNGANYGVWGSVRFMGPNSALYKKIVGSVGYVDNAGAPLGANITGQWQSATAVTAVRFLFSTGNITSGVIRVYGVTKS